MNWFTRAQPAAEPQAPQQTPAEQLADLDKEIAEAKTAFLEADFQERRHRSQHHPLQQKINAGFYTRVNSMQLDLANRTAQELIRRRLEAQDRLNRLLAKRADLKVPGWRQQ